VGRKKLTKIILRIIGFYLILCAWQTDPCYATTIIGEGIEFSPASAMPGDVITLLVRYRIEGDPADVVMSWTMVTVPANVSTPPPPNIILGRLGPGNHSFKIPYAVPNPPPLRVCFDIKWGTQSIITGACLEGGLRAAGGGKGLRASSAPLAPLTPGGRPDLVVENLTVENRCPGFRIQARNYPIGRGTARTEVGFDVANMGETVAVNAEWKVVIQYDFVEGREGENRYRGDPIDVDFVARTAIVTGSIASLEPRQRIRVRRTLAMLADRTYTCGLPIYRIEATADPANRLGDSTRENNQMYLGGPSR